jgi:hypothetical protein
MLLLLLLHLLEQLKFSAGCPTAPEEHTNEAEQPKTQGVSAVIASSASKVCG